MDSQLIAVHHQPSLLQIQLLKKGNVHKVNIWPQIDRNFMIQQTGHSYIYFGDCQRRKKKGIFLHRKYIGLMDYSIPPPTLSQKKIFTNQPSTQPNTTQHTVCHTRYQVFILVNSAVFKILKQFPGKVLNLIDLVTSSKPS